ncbi:hypothetical protein C3F09_07780, partial [candidate division GN15 bacterium]
MIKRLLWVTLVLTVLSSVLAVTVGASVRPVDPRLQEAKRFDVRVSETGSVDLAQPRPAPAASVGVVKPNVVDSRGALVAQTWRDWQSFINSQNNIAINPVTSPASDAGVHMAFTARGASGTMNRFGYAAYDPTNGTYPFPGGTIIVNDNSPTSAELGEQPRVMVYPATGEAIVAGIDMTDYNNGATWQVQAVRDFAPMSGNFGDIISGTIIPDATAKSGSWTVDDWAARPQAALSVFGSDTTLYIATRGGVTDANANFSIKVFRKHGMVMPVTNPDPTWELVFLDTSSNNSQMLATDPLSSTVAVVWTKFANGDITGGTGDDVWYAKSPTGASGTWTKTNLTHLDLNADRSPWTLVSTIFDSQGKLHIIYPASDIAGGQGWNSIICKLWHWSEQDNRTWLIYDATWSLSTVCGRIGSNVMNVGRTAIAECNGRLYVTFSANDSMLTGHYDDCCQSQTFTYSGNAEIFMTISKDLTGKSWDRPRNLSNSYTPNCDTGTCASDHFGSLTNGMRDADYSGVKNWSNAVTYDAGGGYTGEWYLHLLYSTDRYPGYGGAGAGWLGNPGAQGPNTLNDIRWIRLGCVSPVMAANLVLSPAAITFPTYTRPSHDTTITIRMENQGNQDLVFTSVTDIEDSAKGPGAGPTNWMTVSGVPTGIPETMRDSFKVTLNAGGVITAGPTVLFGKIRLQYTAPPQTKDFPIYFTVADTIANAVWDTIATSCTDLAVGTNGNIGHNYGDSSGFTVGKVNMDYFGSVAECDTGLNSRGDSRIYLGDGSPIIIRKPTSTTYRGSWSAYSAGLSSPNGFKPMTGTGYAPHGAFSTAS